MIFKTESGWVSKKIPGSGLGSGTRWALALTSVWVDFVSHSHFPTWYFLMLSSFILLPLPSHLLLQTLEAPTTSVHLGAGWGFLLFWSTQPPNVTASGHLGQSTRNMYRLQRATALRSWWPSSAVWVFHFLAAGDRCGPVLLPLTSRWMHQSSTSPSSSTSESWNWSNFILHFRQF